MLNHKYLELLRVYPEVEPPQVPQGVSDAIARPFIEAADNLRQKKYSSACAMFRRVLEIALKEFAQDIEARTLEKRIDKLAADHLITPAMKEWAHNLRLDGNEAIHGLEEATQELAEQMHDLCKFLLIYLYTLPKQVAEARNKRGVV